VAGKFYGEPLSRHQFYSNFCSLKRGRDVRLWHKADVPTRSTNVRFSNRPVWVKHFQAVAVTRGLVLLYGIGTQALPS